MRKKSTPKKEVDEFIKNDPCLDRMLDYGWEYLYTNSCMYRPPLNFSIKVTFKNLKYFIDD